MYKQEFVKKSFVSKCGFFFGRSFEKKTKWENHVL
jgi:hypothetical protein